MAKQDEIKDEDFNKLDKFEKLSDNTLTEISESDLLGSGASSSDTNINETDLGQQSQPQSKSQSQSKPDFAFEHKETGEPSAINLATFLSPELVVEGLDSLIPLLFVYSLSAMKVSIKKSQLQLTQKEKQTIEPLVESCLAELNILIKSPFAALGIMLAIFYGSKAVEFGIKAKETKKAETDNGAQPTIVKDTRGRKKGTTKEVIAQRQQA